MKQEEKLQAALAAIEEKGPMPGTSWKHYRTGKIYRVDGCVILEDTMTPTVAFHSQRWEPTWVRTLTDFLGMASAGGKMVPRFTQVEDER